MRLPIFRFGGFELDPAARELRRQGERVPLAPKSFDCLTYLVAHRDRAVGRDELIAAVWGRVDITDTVVAQTMLRARKALGDVSQGFVRTVPRFGYHWVAPIQEIARGEVAPAIGTMVGDAAPATFIRGERTPAWRRRIALGIIVVAALTGVVAWPLLPVPGAPWHVARLVDTGAVLVLPVRVESSDGEDAWVSLGTMDYLASRLRQGGLRVVPSEQALHLNAQAAASRPLDPAQAQALQRLGEVRWVIAPEAVRDARGWRLRLAVFHDGHEHLIEARGASALAAAASAADAWLRRVHPHRARSDVSPGELDERLQQVDAVLLAGKLTAARRRADRAALSRCRYCV
ncbi:transcriptional regulator [Lysobacter sp. LF1]|uniref:Transcriptional regulator n=1 Tax=Lysobacter stagni TaxID=3045172 RepID=A0ABT6XCL3_9GAMM|nr:transcriptional regulator [Lysobacter sp. LF1]MDI9237877.1 transcriptional regulator [Lysobacter sp. LF1]